MRDMRENDIAIIGYAFDFPEGVDSNDKFWDVLRNGKDLVREIPKERWDWKKIYSPDPNAEGKSYSYHGAFLKDIEQFDAKAFRIMPVEAKGIDPQQRLVLKTAWRALENSYLNIEKLKHSNTGVFIGATMDDYLQLQTRVDSGKHIDRYTHTGAVLNDISGRVSYVYGFQGPSMTIDTACSSSLAAVDSAIKALKENDCEIALAGGVNVILTEEMYIKFSRTQMLSKTGACKTFDDSADGYVRGEGCGILILQKLKEAQESGKRILAVIRGSSINHNGNSGGLTVPSGKAQIMLLKNCMNKAGVAPEEIDYVEAHGTGTQLGDKVEVNALQEVFKGRKNPVLIGSVKTNMGHLESAAGVAGIIKMLLCMEHNEFVPSIHLKHKNKKINWENTPVEVVGETISWNSEIKLVGVSSFGASGTNGHIIMQKYENTKIEISEEQVGKFYLAVSAKSKVSLRKLLIAISEFIKVKDEQEIRDLCKLYNLTRSDYGHRVVINGTSKEEFSINILKKLKDILEDERQQEIEDTCILCNFANALEKYKQLEIDNKMYHNMVERLKEKVIFETDEREVILMGVVFCLFVDKIGLKKYKLVGDNQVKLQAMLASEDREVYNEIIERYINKEAVILEKLEKYQATNFIFSNTEEVITQSLQEILLEIAASQYEAGAKIQWDYLYTNKQIKASCLPGYEFDESHYWIDYQKHAIDDLKKVDVLEEYLCSLNEEISENEFTYTFKLRRANTLVEQHQIYHKQVLVGTFQVMLIEEIAKRLFGNRCIIKELYLLQRIEPEADLLLKLTIKNDMEQKRGSILEQDENGEWHTKTMFTISTNVCGAGITDTEDVEFVGEFVEVQMFYQLLSQAGLNLGSSYKVVKAIIKSKQKAIALIEETNLQPAILDSASQLLYLYREQETDLYIPTYFTAYEQWASLEKVNRVEGKILAKTEDELIAELTYYVGERLVAKYSNYHLKRVEKKEIISLEQMIGKHVTLPDETELYQYTIKVAGTSLNDHVVYDRVTIPGAYFISQMMQFAENNLKQDMFEISNVNFYHAMILEENKSVKEIIQINKSDENYDVRICSSHSSKEAFVDNAKMMVNKRTDVDIPSYEGNNTEEISKARHLTSEEIIKIQWKIGLRLSDTFNWMKEAWISENGIYAELRNEAFELLQDNYGTPPGLIDTSVQILGLFKNVKQEDVGVYIPMTINQITQYQKLKKRLFCSVYNIRNSGSLLTADILYYDPEDNRKVLEFQGLTLIKADRNKFGNMKADEGVIASEEWKEYPFVETNEDGTCTYALEVRLGILNRKIIVTKYQVEGVKWCIRDKKIFGFEDNDSWQVLILEEIKKQEQQLLILSDSTVEVDLTALDVEKANELSGLLTNYYLSILKLLQKEDSKYVLCFVTNQVYSGNADTMNVLGSIVWGLIRSIQLELSNEKIMLYDTDNRSSQMIKGIDRCVKNKITQSINYNGHTKVPSIEKSVVDTTLSPYIFASEKSYVLIGGFGALGLETCKIMITTGVKRLIVIGRSSLNQKKEEYNLLLQMDEGLSIDYHQLDMSINGASEKLIEILTKEDSIGGIVYAVGVVKDKIFTNYTEDDIQAVYKSKINGMISLTRALEDITFDFCVCFSSIVGVMGAAGQSVYGAANSFIDSLCNFKRKEGKNIFAIQWGPWAEIGMFSKVDKLGVKRYEDRNIYTLQAREALEAFLISLNKGMNQIIVNQKGHKKDVAFKKVETFVESDIGRPVKDRIREIIKSAIGFSNSEKIDEDQSLMDLGIDSLLMIEIRMKINKTFDVSISLDEFFNNMTIDKLSQKIDKSN